MNQRTQSLADPRRDWETGTDNRRRVVRIWLQLTVVFALICSLGSIASAEPVGEIVSLLGTAEIYRDGRWHELKPGEPVAAGAVLRTGDGSRVALQLTNGTQLKLNANSRLELKAVTPHAQGFLPVAIPTVKNILRVLSGEVWIRNSGEPLEVQTLPAIATVRGTEFNLAVEPDESTSLAVLEGLVELANPQGRVFVSAREQAMAKLGQPPHKTVLLEPLDAVQWSLYYPGYISFRDYPLTRLSSSDLRRRAATFDQVSQQSTRLLVEQGEVNYDLGRSKEARRALERAVQLAPGNRRARTGLGWVYLEGGEARAALSQFRRVKPATPKVLAGEALGLYQLNRFDEARQVTAAAKRRFPKSPLFDTQAARNALVRGEPTRALQALDRALALDPKNAVAYSLRSNVYLVQNRKDDALRAAEQAVEVNSSSPSAYLALSIAKQADFELEAALTAARKAVSLDPHNPVTKIQEVRLLFGMGRTREAYEIAEFARRHPPKDSMIESTWGFLLLTRGDVDEAMNAFAQAISLDSTRGEPHLGMGLALFRRNKTDDAVSELRKAALLESQVSLYQSYLGKAFYEVKNDPLANKSFARAKQLDPRDPTPFLYDAIRLQSINRPVEALENLQKSIALNDNRAVYRSRLLLDEDLAARSASLARIYDDLGFDRLAQLQASKSLDLDPANYSAHRFLADSYANRPRHEAARVSELLQARLLQPINVVPEPKQLAETDLRIPGSTGPTNPTLNEYSPLFLRNGLHTSVSGIVGNHETFGDEVSIAGVTNRFSYGIDQFHYENEGYRENNDLTHNIYSFSTQAMITPDFNMQAALRWRRTSNGDLRERYERPNIFSRALRQDIEEQSLRLSTRTLLSSDSNLLLSLTYIDRSEKDQSLHPTLFPEISHLESHGFDVQGQYISKIQNISLVSGLGYYDIDNDLKREIKVDGSCPFTVTGCVQKPASDDNKIDGYIYNYWKLTNTIMTTLGFSASSFKDGLVEFDSLNPKVGIEWKFTKSARLRAASFKTVKRSLILEETLEPTAVSGFNQVFDDFNGTRAKFFGIGIDAEFSKRFYGGIELSRRNLKTPRQFIPEDVVRFENQREDAVRAYLNWSVMQNLTINFGYQFEQFKRDRESITVHTPDNRTIIRVAEGALPTKVETKTVPVSVVYTRPSGLFFGLSADYVVQRAELSPSAPKDTPHSGEFLDVSSTVGYRLPKRKGFIGLEVNNLFNRHFRYQDENIQTAEPSEPRYIPDRNVQVRVSLNF